MKIHKSPNRTQTIEALASTVSLCLGLVLSSAPALAAAGGSDRGGGDHRSAQFVDVSKRALNAAKILCSYKDTSNAVACASLPKLEFSISNMKVVPRSRDSVRGPDGQPRDAGNDGAQGGHTVFLDVDRWSDQFKLTNQSAIAQARYGQVTLAIHEPLVLVGVESNDSYNVSSTLVEMIKKNGFDLNVIVGVPELENNLVAGTSMICGEVVDTSKIEVRDNYLGGEETADKAFKDAAIYEIGGLRTTTCNQGKNRYLIVKKPDQAVSDASGAIVIAYPIAQR